MAKQEVKHPDKSGAAPYSAGVLVDGWLYVSGQGPLDYRTGRVIEGTIQEQTKLTLENVEKVLKAGGCALDDVVKCACHLADIRDFSAFNGVYLQFFKGVLPARTTVQSVLWGGMKVEIDAVARVGKR